LSLLGIWVKVRGFRILFFPINNLRARGLRAFFVFGVRYRDLRCNILARRRPQSLARQGIPITQTNVRDAASTALQRAFR